MQAPVEIHARRAVLSPDQEADLRGQAARLDRLHARILGVRATVEGPGAHHRQGTYCVRLDLLIPGAVIIIDRQSAEEVGLAVHRAFAAAASRITSA